LNILNNSKEKKKDASHKTRNNINPFSQFNSANVTSSQKKSVSTFSNAFFTKTLNMIQNTGFPRQAQDFNQILKQLKLREKNIKHFEIDLEKGMKQTQFLLEDSQPKKVIFRNFSLKKIVKESKFRRNMKGIW
jgi:hypothetical protein